MLNGAFGYAGNYGNGTYPFFKNFWVGGVDSVRGYDTSAIGPYTPPRASSDSSGNPITLPGFYNGGTKKVVGNAELFFPIPGAKDSNQLRLSVFFDAGQVWESSQSINFGDLRYSTGAGVAWYSPFGPIKLVFAKALNPSSTDRTQIIQFQLGQQF
jgi:outer membrane protein insertion porin family